MKLTAHSRELAQRHEAWEGSLRSLEKAGATFQADRAGALLGGKGLFFVGDARDVWPRNLRLNR